MGKNAFLSCGAIPRPPIPPPKNAGNMNGGMVNKWLKMMAIAIFGVAILGATSLAATSQVIYGTNGDDVIHGNKLQNGKPAQIIYAKAGNDRVWGGKGEDYVYGQKGDDRLHAYHASAGYLYGGPGFDRCTIAVFPGGMTKVHTDSCEKIILKPSQGHG